MAICIFCGSEKLKPFDRCTSCNRTPSTQTDQAKSMVLTEDFLKPEALAKVGKQIRDGKDWTQSARAQKLIDQCRSMVRKQRRPASKKAVSQLDTQRIPCPYCGEMIIEGSRKCRFCLEWLDGESMTNPARHESSLIASGAFPAVLDRVIASPNGSILREHLADITSSDQADEEHVEASATEAQEQGSTCLGCGREFGDDDLESFHRTCPFCDGLPIGMMPEAYKELQETGQGFDQKDRMKSPFLAGTGVSINAAFALSFATQPSVVAMGNICFLIAVLHGLNYWYLRSKHGKVLAKYQALPREEIASRNRHFTSYRVVIAALLILAILFRTVGDS